MKYYNKTELAKLVLTQETINKYLIHVKIIIFRAKFTQRIALKRPKSKINCKASTRSLILPRITYDPKKN
jgi:hypothetical protein